MIKNVFDKYWKAVSVLLYWKAVPPERGIKKGKNDRHKSSDKILIKGHIWDYNIEETQITNKCSKKHKKQKQTFFPKKFKILKNTLNAGSTKFKSTGA